MTLNPDDIREDGAKWSEPGYTLAYERTRGVKDDSKFCVLAYWKVNLYHFGWNEREDYFSFGHAEFEMCICYLQLEISSRLTDI